MSNSLIVIFAYLIDRKFGEFTFIKHPIIYIGELITFFENSFYKDSIFRGFLLVSFTIFCTTFLSFCIYFSLSYLPYLLNLSITSFIASIFIAHNMLYKSVKEVLTSNKKKEVIAMLVSRDTENMSESDIYKAGIESYAENLSDGVIAPMFYLLLFNLPGIVVYKTINTLDSMVGYRDKKHEKYGKVAAILDDVVNFIPARITAVIIMLVSKQKNIFSFYADGKKHESPNAGHPITAMALACGVKLGGDTFYFKKLKKKPFFGKGREHITQDDLKTAINLI